MAERIVQQPVATAVQEKFGDLPTAEVDRSTFDMSHPWKGTLHQINDIVPVLVQEVLPGDTFNVKTTAFMRLATPLKPIMDSITADIHYFFVPNRLVWDDWQLFMGERKKPDDDPASVVVPQVLVNIALNDLTTGYLQDYMGLPMQEEGGSPSMAVNTLPFRGYALIYNEWYRNQNLEEEVPINTTSEDDDARDPFDRDSLATVRNRMKRADYFTKALPWPQKGDPVFLPLGERAPVVSRSPGLPSFQISGNISTIGKVAGGDNQSADWLNGSMPNGSASWSDPSLEADLSVATAATINDIRTAFQVQRLLERDARGGTRYIEIILSHFNVQSPDMRLQRPEYIGGGSNRIMINPVAATVATEDAPQGNLSAVGTGVVNGNMNHSFTEHGYLFCLLSCRADLTYQQGLDKHWSRRTRYDYYWPALSHLGEQAILNKEIFFTPNDQETNNTIWGYQERYAEYRYNPGRITGLFRSNHPESLDVWHLAQDFEDLPPLNISFITENPPIERVIAVPSEPPMLIDCWHNIKATRPMPVYAVPGLVDHF